MISSSITVCCLLSATFRFCTGQLEIDRRSARKFFWKLQFLLCKDSSDKKFELALTALCEGGPPNFFSTAMLSKAAHSETRPTDVGAMPVARKRPPIAFA